MPNVSRREGYRRSVADVGRTGWRIVLGIAVSVPVVMGLVACTSAHVVAQPATAKPAGATPQPSAQTAGATVGTGTFTSPDGKTSSTVALTLEGTLVVLTVHDFRSAESGALQPNLSPWTPYTRCLVDQNSLVLSQVSSNDLRRIPVGFQRSGPTFYQTLVVARPAGSASGSTDQNGCAMTPLAFAPIAWTLPDPRPGLAVVDAGSETGARGTVTVISGAPTTYLVADGDNLSSIADRLGITVDDILFLNPLDSAPLQPDQRLNLSKALRGSGSVPPPCVGIC